LLRCLTNRHDNAFQFLHHIVIGETQHAVPTRREPSIAAIIAANALLEIMTFTIDLDDKLAGVSDEVRDVIAHRALSTKSET
jgi:hypothetical protein